MPLEIAILKSKPEFREDFGAAMERHAANFVTDPRCHSTELWQSVETPDEFLFFADWTQIEDHLEFRNGPIFGAYRAEVAHAFAEPPTFRHYE